MLRSLPRITLLAGTLAVASALSACGTTDLRPEGVGAGLTRSPGPSGSDSGSDSGPSGYEPAGFEVIPGTRQEAQRVVDTAERRFLEEPSAEYWVYWVGSGDEDLPMEGSFDIEQPAAEVTAGLDEDNRYELRLRGEDTWMRVTAEGKAMDCWMHITGSGEDGGLSGVPYQGLMLLEPVALGRQQLSAADKEAEKNGHLDVGDRIVVELRLEEALPAVLPRMGGLNARPIDPAARVRALAVVGVHGRYLSLEYNAADLFDALKRSKGGIPRELRQLAKSPGIRAMTAIVNYHDYGLDVRVTPPPRAKVAELGSWRDVVAGRVSGAPTCAAARQGS